VAMAWVSSYVLFERKIFLSSPQVEIANHHLIVWSVKYSIGSNLYIAPYCQLIRRKPTCLLHNRFEIFF